MLRQLLFALGDITITSLPFLPIASKKVVHLLGSTLSPEERKAIAEKWNPTVVTTEKKASILITDFSSHKKQDNLNDDIFGELIHDFGFKKVFSMDLVSLVKLPVWKNQRIYRQERADLIAKENKDFKGFPGIITLFTLPNKKQGHKDASLIDGQHRVGALKVLQANGNLLKRDEKVLVEVFDLDDEKEVEKLFSDINSAQPLQLIDLPETLPNGDKKIIDEACERIKHLFPEMFKASKLCPRPYINIDTLRDNLREANILEQHEIKNTQDLVNWMLESNAKLAKVSEANWLKQEKGARWPNTVKKAIKSNFYLGLQKHWMFKVSA